MKTPEDLESDNVRSAEPAELQNGNGEEVDVDVDGTPAEVSDALEIPTQLPVLPTRDAVPFPGTIMPLRVSRAKSRRVLDMALTGSRLVAVVSQRVPETEEPAPEDLYRVGTACVILKKLKTSDGADTIIVHGLRRVGLVHIAAEKDSLAATVRAHQDPTEVTDDQKAQMLVLSQAANRMIELSASVPDEARQVLNSIQTPGGLADFLAANIALTLIQKQEILETFDVGERLRKMNVHVASQLDLLELSAKIQSQVKEQVDHSQREYYLREQIKAMQSELGEGEGGDRSQIHAELKARIKKAQMPAAVEKEALHEAERLQSIPQASPEYSMTHDYVEWLVELPWSVSTEDHLDIARAQQILDEDHYGLERVKRRIIEFLAVRRLKRDSRGPILCFTGPPGVGKTSLGQSIARAMGRNFIRVSLGGIRDEATIRGHRRTYIGSMPGRIIREIRRAASNNPLFMLDEIDKIGQDVRGDPMSALLEVLDPAQNGTFSDHYLGVPFDLSKVLFIATANYISAIEQALRDRMEIIELPSYTHDEKIMIAKRHLLPRQVMENGLKPEQIAIDDDMLSLVIADYTREAGVRSLERQIGAVCRARAAAIVRGDQVDAAVTEKELRKTLGPKEFESEVAASLAQPGVVTGLAFTPVGGDILFIEARKMPGSGQFTLTGQLGDVMRESARAAQSIVRSRTGLWGVRAPEMKRHDLHIHVPAGAIPKDGPSAGVAMLAAITSVLTGEIVDPTIGMTGEITLSGRVLPVGGIREKVLAAHRAGLRAIILPKRNQRDLEELPDEVRADLRFIPVETIDDLFRALFTSQKKVRGHGKRSTSTKRPRGKGKATTAASSRPTRRTA